jgi:3-methyladenine DNA glycosylase AlkD
MATELTSSHFIDRLQQMQSDEELQKLRKYFKFAAGEYAEGDEFMGVRMGSVFDLAKEFIEMPLHEIEALLESPIHEARVGAVSIMDFQARSGKFSKDRKKSLYELYLRRHDRINNWDLVDRAAPHVVGGYLYDQPRDVLYELAVSDNLWARRTAIVSTWYFIRKGEVDDTFRIAEILINDDQDLIHKATGGWIREAGKREIKKLLLFLDKYAASMPRTALRNAIEHLDPGQRAYYLTLRN